MSTNENSVAISDDEARDNIKDLIVTIAEGLVDDRRSITVEFEESDDGEWIYHLNVAHDETGRIIGKQGRVIKSIRTIVRSGAARFEKRVNVVVDDAPIN